MLRLRLQSATRRCPRWTAAALAGIVALRLVLESRPALADAPGASSGPWVRVAVAGPSPEFARRVLEDLHAGLAGSRVGACAEDVAGRPPLAVVRVAPSASETSRYSIDVSDAVTRKRLARDVDLGRVPSDGRAFAIAVAAEELLRASWAELDLRERKRDRPSPARAGAETSPSSSPPPVAPGNALGARFALEHYTHGQTQFGGDVCWSRALAPSLGVTLGLGLRKGLDTDAEHGSVQSSAIAAELALEPQLVSGGAFSLNAVFALRGAQASYRGVAVDGAIARAQVGYALFARGGFSLVATPGAGVLARTGIGAGAPLRSFSAADAGERVTGMGGLELFANTGVAVEF